MKKKTDGGYDIPEKESREMQEEENAINEPTDDIDSQTGYCRFCGQAGIIETDGSWTQFDVNEAVTCQCRCDMAKRYIESKERKEKAKNRIIELFGSTAERPVDDSVIDIMQTVVDVIEAKHMKGITIDIGQGVKAKVSKMAKESIKVERSETSKTIYEE